MTTTHACPECGQSGSLYRNAEFKLDGDAWSFTGYADDGECTECDHEFAPDDHDMPDLPGFLPVATMERLEAFLCGFEDDDTQEGVADMLRDLRAALGKE